MIKIWNKADNYNPSVAGASTWIFTIARNCRIDLIRKKQFIFIKKFTDKEVLSERFLKEVIDSFKAIRPYFNYMSNILTTNLNGESIL